MDKYEQQLYAIKEQQQNKHVKDLEAARDKALTGYTDQETELKEQTKGLKKESNISSQLQKLNLANFMARRGQTSAGINMASEMSRQGSLSNRISDINLGQTQVMGQIEQGRAQANKDFENQKASGFASIETDIATQLLNYKERLRQEQAQIDEQLRREALEKEEQLRREAESERIRLDEWDRNIKERQRQEKAQLKSSGGGGGSGGYFPLIEDTLPAVSTDYYQGDYNPDVAKGTFSNGYQPNNIGGKKLTNTKSTIKFNTQTLNGKTKVVTQTIWKTPDGKKWVWDGRYNEYLPASLYK